MAAEDRIPSHPTWVHLSNIRIGQTGLSHGLLFPTHNLGDPTRAALRRRPPPPVSVLKTEPNSMVC
jgi:hypothetical protein